MRGIAQAPGVEPGPPITAPRGSAAPDSLERIGPVVSTSATKDLQPPGRVMENLGIVRLRSAWMGAI